MEKTKQQCFVFGPKAFLEALENKLVIQTVNLTERHKKLLPTIKAHRLNFVFHSSNGFKHQFHQTNHQELATAVNIKQIFKPLDQLIALTTTKKTSTLVMLDEIQDPYNFGAILRTCYGAEVDGIIFKKANQVPVNSTVIKTSMGTVFYQNLVQVANLSYAIKALQAVGFGTVATTLDENYRPIDYRKVDFEKRILLVGNENQGINNLLLKNADLKIKIPLNPKLNSLNVSVATGIILFGGKS